MLFGPQVRDNTGVFFPTNISCQSFSELPSSNTQLRIKSALLMYHPPQLVSATCCYRNCGNQTLGLLTSCRAVYRRANVPSAKNIISEADFCDVLRATSPFRVVELPMISRQDQVSVNRRGKFDVSCVADERAAHKCLTIVGCVVPQVLKTSEVPDL